MSQYEIQIFGNAERCRTEAGILAGLADGPLTEVATVFETADGWEMQSFDDRLINELGAVFDAAVEEAKERLRHYVNRTGENVPEGLSPAGLSFWLMEKDDGTAMGKPVEG
jgi:hypothetical protein